jgi:hypothetical protein
VSAGIPILILKAPSLTAQGSKPRIGEFDYLAYLQAISGRNSHVAIKFIEGTNHSFADAVGRAAVRQHTQEWLSSFFPARECEEVEILNSLQSIMSESK